MADEIKFNRTAQPAAQRPDHYQPAMAESRESMQEPSASKTPWVILAVIVILLIVGGVAFREKIFGKKMNDSGPVSSGYQAIFLTNGQVYFGKLSDIGKQYVTMTDIYYLQVGPQQGNGTNGQASSTPPQSISLVKLGNELHGPVDEMHINQNQILFYENLKDDGQVVKTILQDKNSKK